MDCGVFLRIVLPDFLGSSLSFQCRTLRFPKNRTRAFLLVVARCAASYLWKSFNEAFDVIGKRSVYGMDFQLEFGFYSTPALPRSVCCSVVALQQNPELLLKLPSSVPLDLLFLRIFVCGVLCIFSVLFYAGIARAPPASVGCVFLRIVLLDFLGSSLSFSLQDIAFSKE